ncbi:MAG: DUF2726 domain-containing protein [Candidatus Sacchiramonaceae bacterium]|nr:DUF2726 domain-containing protein [Candidatus Saccharimonadaceae bacterium]
MESIILLLILVATVVTARYYMGAMIRDFNSLPSRQNGSKKDPRRYKYYCREAIITTTENEFYHKIKLICGDNLVVLPQIHLSSIFNHKVKGQKWKAAFSRINGKSVDFLLCHPEAMRPVAAIEIDDRSHLRRDRIERDEFVDSIFKMCNIPLLHVTDLSISNDDLKRALVSCISTRYLVK